MLRQFSDRLLGVRLKKDEREIKIAFFVLGTVIAILLVNIVYLNLQVITGNSKTTIVRQTVIEKNGNIEQNQSIIQPETSNLEEVASNKSNKISFKDYYINLGSGSSKSTDWVDVNGTFNTYDISSYNNVQAVSLETTTNVPTSNGTYSVRLYNKTDGNPVWNSERTVQAEQNGSLLISQNITYPRGPKLYSVQMKSQIGVELVLIQARLHIVSE